MGWYRSRRDPGVVYAVDDRHDRLNYLYKDLAPTAKWRHRGYRLRDGMPHRAPELDFVTDKEYSQAELRETRAAKRQKV